MDHASKFVQVESQLGFSAIETIRAKLNFEKFAFNNGVIPLTYLTDSGAHMMQLSLARDGNNETTNIKEACRIPCTHEINHPAICLVVD